MSVYIITFFLSVTLTLLLTPLARKLALLVGAVDKPSNRKIHTKIITRFGGLSIYLSFVISIWIGLELSRRFGLTLNTKEVSSILGIILGGTLITLVGLIDDLKGLPPLVKLIGQILASLIAVYFGTQILYVSTPFTQLLLLGTLAPVITVLWMVSITNAMNLIDGLDGLASGIAVIAGAALFVVAIKTGQRDAAILLAALTGAAFGFLKYNFFPATIFLGDSGSLLLGFTLACASIVGVLKSTLVIALIVPIAVLGIPLYDTAAAIIRRAFEGRSIFEADKRHIHHRLLKAGFNQRQVVIIIYIACIILSIAALTATVFDNYQALILLSMFIVLGVVALEFAKERLRNLADKKGNK
jgi:UDP-GlcNAc:undecaprenyl-phosphate GlcNAc-1-phosphate transferase